jgi:hypothetical protein
MYLRNAMQRAKNRVIVIQKEKRQRGPFSF